MSTSAPLPHEVAQPDLGAGVSYAHGAVDVSGVRASLLAFIGKMGVIHRAIFGAPLEITSGRDGQHTPGSKHYDGKAVDVRTADKSQGGNELFLHALAFFSPGAGVGVFDERHMVNGAHLHLEVE